MATCDAVVAVAVWRHGGMAVKVQVDAISESIEGSPSVPRDLIHVNFGTIVGEFGYPSRNQQLLGIPPLLLRVAGGRGTAVASVERFVIHVSWFLLLLIRGTSISSLIPGDDSESSAPAIKTFPETNASPIIWTADVPAHTLLVFQCHDSNGGADQSAPFIVQAPSDDIDACVDASVTI
ncbi:hypothetical protein BGW80DRAFT_1564266 [Lactifluus volemus]|nr:hypothetical protein BGW80DRAFT_1564266 [Lactifluus volemus]